MALRTLAIVFGCSTILGNGLRMQRLKGRRWRGVQSGDVPKDSLSKDQTAARSSTSASNSQSSQWEKLAMLLGIQAAVAAFESSVLGACLHVLNPSIASSHVLFSGYLRMCKTSMRDEKPSLVNKVKDWQRKSVGHRESWYNYVRQLGSRDKDPNRHDVAVLADFIAQAEAGMIEDHDASVVHSYKTPWDDDLADGTEKTIDPEEAEDFNRSSWPQEWPSLKTGYKESTAEEEQIEKFDWSAVTAELNWSHWPQEWPSSNTSHRESGRIPSAEPTEDVDWWASSERVTSKSSVKELQSSNWPQEWPVSKTSHEEEEIGRIPSDDHNETSEWMLSSEPVVSDSKVKRSEEFNWSSWPQEWPSSKTSHKESVAAAPAVDLSEEAVAEASDSKKAAAAEPADALDSDVELNVTANAQAATDISEPLQTTETKPIEEIEAMLLRELHRGISDAGDKDEDLQQTLEEKPFDELRSGDGDRSGQASMEWPFAELEENDQEKRQSPIDALLVEKVAEWSRSSGGGKSAIEKSTPWFDD